MKQPDDITRFYMDHLSGAEVLDSILQAPCPFCAKESGSPGKLIVSLNPEGYFHGYFRCLNRCVPGGFPLHFARLKKIDLSLTPGFDPDREPFVQHVNYPVKNINDEVKKNIERMTDDIYERFSKSGISKKVLREMQIGYNGRYLVFPYVQEDGNCYAARCVHPGKPEDTFWYGDEAFFSPRFQIFNINEIARCENGALIVVEGEENLLTLKQLGLPGIAVAGPAEIENINAEILERLHTVFLCINHRQESDGAARSLATKIGFKARIIKWPESEDKNFCLTKLALREGENFRNTVFDMIRAAKSFSPFSSPQREHIKFLEGLSLHASEKYKTMLSGFPKLDQALNGIHGINIIGGTPKAGKSCLVIQIATEMAKRRLPVIYYDFENGRQKIYHRTLCRLSRLPTEAIKSRQLSHEQQNALRTAQETLKSILPYFRVVTDRKLTPEIMRRHIDFLRHETNSQFTVVVIDSLHKLPFKDFSERRTGIDAWLRQLEAIRDELNVSFLVISELSRDKEGVYGRQPHLGSFKGSGDIGYSADNAMVLMPDWEPFDTTPQNQRCNNLWLVASREHSPGLIGSYRLDYPYWGFVEKND